MSRWPIRHCHPTHLQHDALVDGELCDDVGQQQVAVVLGGWVNAVLGQQARPRKRHQPPQLVALLPGGGNNRIFNSLSC